MNAVDQLLADTADYFEARLRERADARNDVIATLKLGRQSSVVRELEDLPEKAEVVIQIIRPAP